MEEKIYQCVLMSLMLGFEPAKKTNLPYKLENIACDGQTAMRDAVLKGTSMLLQLRKVHIEMQLPNLWQFVHIVITDGADNQSEVKKPVLMGLMQMVGNEVPPELLKTIYIGVDLKENDTALKELKELTNIGGRGAELKNIKAGEMEKIFHKIKVSLQQRVQMRQLNLQADNQQLQFTQLQFKPQIQIEFQRYLILFTLDVSGSMSGERWNKVTKAVRDILSSLGDDDMVCGIVFNDKCHVASQINTQTWNREIYQRREKQRQQEEAKQRAAAEAQARGEAQRRAEEQRRQERLRAQQQAQWEQEQAEQEEWEQQQAEWEQQQQEKNSSVCLIQ